MPPGWWQIQTGQIGLSSHSLQKLDSIIQTKLESLRPNSHLAGHIRKTAILYSVLSSFHRGWNGGTTMITVKHIFFKELQALQRMYSFENTCILKINLPLQKNTVIYNLGIVVKDFENRLHTSRQLWSLKWLERVSKRPN